MIIYVRSQTGYPVETTIFKKFIFSDKLDINFLMADVCICFFKKKKKEWRPPIQSKRGSRKKKKIKFVEKVCFSIISHILFRFFFVVVLIAR